MARVFSMGQVLHTFSSQETTTDAAASRIQIPVETTLRILQRYALYYNPSAKKDLAKTCIALNMHCLEAIRRRGDITCGYFK